MIEAPATLRKILDPGSWRRVVARAMDGRRLRHLEDRLDAAWMKQGPVRFAAGDRTVIADGMWHNPNHFLRLRLFVDALSRRESFRLLGILRRRSDGRDRRALERIGFEDFLYLEEDDQFRTEQFLGEADRLLAPVRSHADLLAIELPHGLPPYIFYDTVLKLARDPHPPLDLPLWRTVLAETLRDLAVYARELESRNVAHVALSHPWKSEWGTLMWLALGRAVPSYHLTGFVEGMRIRRFRNQADYGMPVEHMPVGAFEALPEAVRSELVRIGTAEMAKRASGASTDLNARYAFRPAERIEERARARAALAGGADRQVVAIYGHVWFDFPHTYAMANFTDFRDWMETTLTQLREIDDVVWLVKPHPTEEWYGGFRLADLVRDLPPHVRLLPQHTDSETVLIAADAVVTVHGTIGLEAAAHGLPTILADRSYYADWGFAHVARSRADYSRLLRSAGRLQSLSAAQRDRARAAFALSLAEPPAELSALLMSCDSGGAALYEEVIDRAERGAGLLAAERDRVARFLGQSELDSFAAFHLVEYARSRAGFGAARVA